MPLEPDQIIDAKYRVVRRIGEGGMGTVYEGENQRIGRRVAIKVLHAQVAAMPELVERFEREARAAARIGSPHVCDVLDLGDLPDGDRYIVMEYLDGISFEDRLEAGKMTPAELAPVAFELLEGLATMHDARVVHRDLKPANVFLARIPGGRGETVKILDFGVAKQLPFGQEVGTMTRTGMMMGTPLYMSPEQARGARDVDGRTDIYAASVMFYRALTGELPFVAESLNELLFKIVLEDARPLRELAPEVDEGFAALVHRGLARDLEQRFPSARAYQAEIVAWGRQQGRASLSFAATLPISEPPPHQHQSASNMEALSSPRVAVGVTVAGGGTPIAWTEGVAGLLPVREPPLPPLAPSATETSSTVGRATSSSASPEETVPRGPDDTPAARAPASLAPAPGPAPAAKGRPLWIGLIATGGLAAVGLVALGRGGSSATPPQPPEAARTEAAPAVAPPTPSGPPPTTERAPTPSALERPEPSAPIPPRQLSQGPLGSRLSEGAPRGVDGARRTAAPTPSPVPSASQALTERAPDASPAGSAARPAASARRYRTTID
jgi:serine/threonine-protein kinase